MNTPGREGVEGCFWNSAREWFGVFEGKNLCVSQLRFLEANCQRTLLQSMGVLGDFFQARSLTVTILKVFPGVWVVAVTY